ncbi:MAG: hypothetical protein OHK0048_00700 [Rhodoferax sp.]
MLLDINAQPLVDPSRQALDTLNWGEVERLWNANRLAELHDWLNERWSALVRNSPAGQDDPEARFLQAWAFATLALFFTQNHNQEGALLMADDALVALARYRPSFMGVRVEAVAQCLQELRPLLSGLPADAPCPILPFVYPKFEWSRGGGV